MVCKPTHKNYDKYNECQLTVKKSENRQENNRICADKASDKTQGTKII